MARAIWKAALGALMLGAAISGARAVSDEDAVNEKDVMVLTAKNFDSVVQSKEFVLVEFYAPWCGHCKALAPEYAAAATELAASRPDVALGKVDATQEESLGQEHGIEGFPTLYWFVNGSRTEYTGGRDAAEIVSWVMRKTGPPAATIASKGELDALEAKRGAIVVGYFKDFNEADDTYATFKRVATLKMSIEFVQTADKAVAEAAGLSAVGSVAVVQNFEGEARTTVPYSGDWTEAALGKFIDVEQMPPVLAFTEDNTERIFSTEIKRHLLLIGAPDQIAADAKAGGAAFHALAKEMRGEREFVFVTVDAADAETEPALDFFDVALGPTPTLVGFQMEPDQARYRFEGEEMSKDAFLAFARGILDGTVKQAIKSDPVPSNDMDGDVKIVVGKTFEEIVLDPSKDVLLEVYAPWCFHCKNLAPIWAELGTRFKDVDSVVIAKMDGTSNEHPEVSIEGFPTILHFPAKKTVESDPVEGRSLKAFTEHLLKHAATPVKLAKSVADLEKEEQESDARNAEFMKTNAAAAGDDEDYDEEDLETDSDGPQGDDEESVKSEL